MDFLPTLEETANLMQIATGFTLIALTLVVFFHQRKNDKETLRGRAWETQQKINYMALENEAVLRAAELTVSGNFDRIEGPDDLKRAMFMCFIQINRVNSLWRGWKSGLLGESELLDEARPTIRLLLGSLEIFNYCLTRGYSGDFAKFMEKERDYVIANIPQPESGDDWAAALLAKKSGKSA